MQYGIGYTQQVLVILLSTFTQVETLFIDFYLISFLSVFVPLPLIDFTFI